VLGAWLSLGLAPLGAPVRSSELTPAQFAERRALHADVLATVRDEVGRTVETIVKLSELSDLKHSRIGYATGRDAFVRWHLEHFAKLLVDHSGMITGHQLDSLMALNYEVPDLYRISSLG
jgi:hypothetical protein